MTGAAGIPNSSAAPANTLPGKKISGKTMEEERSDLPELPIFADFFSHMESDTSIPDAMPPAPPEETPSNDTAAETPAPAPALQVAATHHEWFGGGDKALPESEPFTHRKPVSFRKTEPEAGERDQPVEQAEQAGQTDLPLPVAAPIGAPPPVAETREAAPADKTRVTILADHVAPPIASPTTSPEIAPEVAPDQTRQQTQLRGLPGWFPGQHSDQEKSARNAVPPNDAVRFSAASVLRAPPARTNRTAANSSPRTETAIYAAGAPRAGQSVSANVQASLSALESVLSRESAGGNANVQMKTADDASGRAQQQQLAMKDAGITSVRQETHFAPAQAQSPALQIAQRITHEMQMGAQNMPQPDAPTEAPKPPARVLHIQLSPPQLGPMTIRMSMQNDGLMIQLQTANHETAQLINRDRDALSGMLRAAGYSVDGLNVQVTAADRGLHGQAPGQGDNFNQTAGHQQGSREAAGRSPDRGGRGGGQQGQSSNPGDQDRATTPGGVRSGGGVYL